VGFWGRAWDEARQYDEIADVGSIARRYFAMNAFDGVVTIIGVVAGAMVAGVTKPGIVVVTGLTTAVAMGVSGFTGAYLTEAAERERGLAKLNKATLRDLHDTRVGRAARFAIVVVTLVDGLSPMLASALVLTPFYFAALMPSIRWAYYGALGFALVVLFGLGLFLGRISKGRLIVYGIKTTLAGAIAIVASLALGGVH
jgi:predicted membrane protein (TIGR00267 family)